LVAAIDFGSTHINVAIGDALGRLVAQEHVEIDTHALTEEAMDAAAQGIASLKSGCGEQLAAIVAGIPVHLNRRSGIVDSTIQSGWLGRVPQSELSRRLGQSVHIENDAVLGAYGELIVGAGRAHRDFCYVKVAHGIGAGLVVGGRLYRGGLGLGGQVGHSRVPGRSELCRCGRRGCLEAAVCVPVIQAQLAVAHASPPATRTEEVGRLGRPVWSTGRPLAGQWISADEIPVLDDAASKHILAAAGSTLGEGLAPVCNLLNPTALILGGDLGGSADFIAGTAAAVERYSQPGIAATVEVLSAELGELAELTGGLRLAGRLALK
jgi:predicted NBD/HSP70 family sugar kinase